MSGSKLRKEPPSPSFAPSSPRRLSPSPDPLGTRPLRIVASGAIFLNHTINVPAYPEENANIRAQAVTRLRGGSAAGTFRRRHPWVMIQLTFHTKHVYQ